MTIFAPSGYIAPNLVKVTEAASSNQGVAINSMLASKRKVLMLKFARLRRRDGDGNENTKDNREPS